MTINGKARGGILAFALLLASCVPAFADPPRDYKPPPPDPPAAGQIGTPEASQLKGSVPDPLVGPGLFRRLPSIDESQWVVVAVSNKPYWSIGKSDPVLTNACRLGDFVSVTFNRLAARFDGKEGRGLLLVVPPTHRHLLIDKRNLSRANETYYFLNSGAASCEVWFVGKGRPRALNTTYGTSLPPPDPKALNKRKALINSWPKD